MEEGRLECCCSLSEPAQGQCCFFGFSRVFFNFQASSVMQLQEQVGKAG